VYLLILTKAPLHVDMLILCRSL